MGSKLRTLPRYLEVLAMMSVRKRIRTNWWWIGLGGVAVILLLIVGYGVYMAPAFIPATHVEVHKYKRIKNHWWYHRRELVEHFPKRLPDDVSDIQLYFTPQFLMGGGVFQVGITFDDDARVDELIDRYSDERAADQSGRDYIGQKVCKGLRDSDLQAHGKVSGCNGFSDDFNVIVLETEELGSPGHRWNHGAVSGVAISRLDKAIVYFAEVW